MDELIEQITKRFGIPAATAKGVVEMVIGFIKQKLQDSPAKAHGLQPRDEAGIAT